MPLKPLNLDDVFRRTARRQPEHPACLGPGADDVLTYADADDAIDRAAALLAAAGVGPGACVGLHCPSNVTYILATYAAWRAGACIVPIPTELTRPEKEQILQTVALDYVISPPTRAAWFAPHQRGGAVALWPAASVYPVTPLCDRPQEFAAINAAFVRFTSGTTATAKGVVLSHETIHERISAANEVLRIGAEDRVVWVLSMAYHFAVSIVAYLSFGAGIILPRDHFAHAILTAARQHDGTIIYASPAHFTWLAHAPDAAPLHALRLAIATTAALDLGTAAAFRERFDLPPVSALGIIEVGLPFINIAGTAETPGAVGKVLPAYELRLADIGLGDKVGEILLRGPGLLDAYYEPWQPRAAILRDGWFHTGDVAAVDDDGSVTLRGRLKDVINVLGMKFFPQEVEAVLRSHPAVESACVVARPDARLGEVPEAKVVLRAGHDAVTERELRAHCESQLALFKIPQRIEFVAALPQTASGKVLRRPAPASKVSP
jgi:long-chain acyl-CoA synthetase